LVQPEQRSTLAPRVVQPHQAVRLGDQRRQRLLRQLAGVGNVYKSEVMFLKRVSPFVKVGELPEETLAALIAEAHRLMRLNDTRGERRTLFGLDQRERLWVYGRNGEPCRVCGETIRMRRQGMDARSTYYCRKCQGVGR
jgi:endonuclease VIII